MRAFPLLLLAACLACSAEDDDDDTVPPEPPCEDHPVATQQCRERGLVTADGKVTGVQCEANSDPDDWPSGCEFIEQNPAFVVFCCPW